MCISIKFIRMGDDDVTKCNFQTGDNSVWGRSEGSNAMAGEAGRAQESGLGGAGEARKARGEAGGAQEAG